MEWPDDLFKFLGQHVVTFPGKVGHVPGTPRPTIYKWLFQWDDSKSLYRNGCFTKHPFINGCLGLQVVICHKSRVPETLKQFQPILKIVRLFFPKIGDNKTIHFQQKNTPQNEHGTHKNWWCASMFLLLKTGYFQVNQPFVFGEGTFPETNSHDVLDRNLGGVAGWPESSRCS